MQLTIAPNIPESETSDITISFAKLFADADFEGLREILSDDAYIVLFNRETKSGRDAVVEYFKDWQGRVGDDFKCEVRWSAQYARPEIYFISEKIKQAYILGIEEDKIVRILLIPCSFSAVGFSIDETPYNIGFIEANLPKEVEALKHHAFCPICGRASETLSWRNGVIFKQRRDFDKKHGLFVNASICPNCNIVCELSTDRTATHVLTMTRDQQAKADKMMTEEEKSQYVDNTLGNRKPLYRAMIKHRTNELAQFGQSFHKLIDEIVKIDSVEKILTRLDKLSFNGPTLHLHVASGNTHSVGDNSYFYIETKKGSQDRLVFRHITASPSIAAAWQIYLLHNASSAMPVFWHGAYLLRDYIFDEAILNDYRPLECHDISGFSRENLLLPKVVFSSDRETANVYCTYWNDWKGLIRECLQITFLPNGKIELTEGESICLFEYNCGILF